MNEIIAMVLSIWVSFLLGVFVVFWLGRGFLGKYLKCFISGSPLLRVHLKRGGFVFRVGSNVPGANIVKYTLWGKKDVRYVTIVPEAVLKAVRASWVDVPELETAPFVYDKVQPFYKEIEVRVKDEKGLHVITDDGEYKTEKKEVLAFTKFLGWDDSPVIRTMVQWALMRPRRKIAGLGIDPKAILAILVVIIIIVVVASQLSGGGSAAANIIG